MERVFLLLLFVVLVNAGCIASFDRAQRALRDLGAAWVRALSSPSAPHDAGDSPPGRWPGVRLRLPRVALRARVALARERLPGTAGAAVSR